MLIIDASSLFRKGRAQNILDPEHAEQIVAWVRAFEDVEDRAKVVDLDEIKSEDWTLNISRYVLPPIGEDIPPLPEAVAAFKQRARRVPRGRGPPARGADRGRLARMSNARAHDPAGARVATCGAPPRCCAASSTPATTSSTSSRCCSSSASPTSGTRSTSRRSTRPATTATPRATANDRFAIPDGAHWNDVRAASRDVGRALLNGDPRHRGGQPRTPRRRLRQRALDQQGAAARRHAQEPDRALLAARR